MWVPKKGCRFLRIISGDLKGKKLCSVRGRIIRPTADRLRESIFNILSFRVQGTVVLDLFAGTGALGLEALSRGAESALFIDNDKDSLSVIEQNIRSCTLGNKAKIIKWDIKKNLNCIRSPGLTGRILPSEPPLFNLVFMDPPYNKNMLKPALCNLHSTGSLEREALIIVEHTLPESIPVDSPELEIADQRRYGKTLVSFLNYKQKTHRRKVGFYGRQDGFLE